MVDAMIRVGVPLFIAQAYYVSTIDSNVDTWVYMEARAIMVIVVLIGIKIPSWVTIMWGSSI